MSVLQESLPSDQDLSVYFADFEFLNFNIQPRSSLMVQHAGLMRKILEACPTGHLAWTGLMNGFDTMLKVNPKLLPSSLTAKKKSDILTWISSGIRVVLSWFRKGMSDTLVKTRLKKHLSLGQQQQLDNCWNIMIADTSKVVKEEVGQEPMCIAKAESVDLVPYIGSEVATTPSPAPGDVGFGWWASFLSGKCSMGALLEGGKSTCLSPCHPGSRA